MTQALLPTHPVTLAKLITLSKLQVPHLQMRKIIPTSECCKIQAKSSIQCLTGVFRYVSHWYCYEMGAVRKLPDLTMPAFLTCKNENAAAVFLPCVHQELTVKISLLCKL